MANMKRTKYGKVDLDYVLGIGGFDLERYGIFFHFIFIITSYPTVSAEVDHSSMHLLRFNCCGSPALAGLVLLFTAGG